MKVTKTSEIAYSTCNCCNAYANKEYLHKCCRYAGFLGLTMDCDSKGAIDLPRNVGHLTGVHPAISHLKKKSETICKALIINQAHICA